MKEVIMQVQSFSSDYPKAPNYVSDLVRCKDCQYCSEYYDKDGYPYWICDEWDGGTDADGFCYYGERKER